MGPNRTAFKPRSSGPSPVSHDWLTLRSPATAMRTRRAESRRELATRSMVGSAAVARTTDLTQAAQDPTTRWAEAETGRTQDRPAFCAAAPLSLLGCARYRYIPAAEFAADDVECAFEHCGDVVAAPCQRKLDGCAVAGQWAVDGAVDCHVAHGFGHQ
jgi:hypothetical protein